jgi:hypothetical protein
MQLTASRRSFLSRVHFAVVSTIASDDMPHQTVMWYMLDGDQLLLSTPRDSVKHKHLKRDDRLGKRYRGTFNPFMVLGFMLRGLTSRLKRRLSGASEPKADTNRMQDMLTRARVTLHLAIEKVHSNSLD